ncbi:hypothetical protein SAMN02787144_1009135 [Streptomyces atratus]|uniref:Uncharacterized protein n=1 Tax=Streptomyces atratus TaxID=1893 RepID=A0A1K2BUT1_STRAR|nr:hypothetical protein SAMN02787144_1009135 [Streptomyces atratus]
MRELSAVLIDADQPGRGETVTDGCCEVLLLRREAVQQCVGGHLAPYGSAGALHRHVNQAQQQFAQRILARCIEVLIEALGRRADGVPDAAGGLIPGQRQRGSATPAPCLAQRVCEEGERGVEVGSRHGHGRHGAGGGCGAERRRGRGCALGVRNVCGARVVGPVRQLPPPQILYQPIRQTLLQIQSYDAGGTLDRRAQLVVGHRRDRQLAFPQDGDERVMGEAAAVVVGSQTEDHAHAAFLARLAVVCVLVPSENEYLDEPSPLGGVRAAGEYLFELVDHQQPAGWPAGLRWW